MKTAPPLVPAQAVPIRTAEERLELKVKMKMAEEEARRERFFDAKQRTIGVDKAALDRQVEEVRQARALERQTDLIFDGNRCAVNAKLSQLELEKQEKRRRAEYECYHSNRPPGETRAVEKELPPRVSDDDPRCGPASMQKFGGEDLLCVDRKLRQQKQVCDWIEQQAFEKSLKKAELEREEAEFGEHMKHIVDLRTQVEEYEASARDEINRSMAAENWQRAEQQLGVARGRCGEEETANQEELRFHASDPFLTESRKDGPDGTPQRQEDWKGMGSEGELATREAYRLQMEEKQARREAERQQTLAEARQSEVVRRKLVFDEQEKQRAQRALAAHTLLENRAIAQAAADRKTRARSEYLGPTEEFFGQFNKRTL